MRFVSDTAHYRHRPHPRTTPPKRNVLIAKHCNIIVCRKYRYLPLLLFGSLLLITPTHAPANPENPATNRGVLPSEKPDDPPPIPPRELLTDVGLGSEVMKSLQRIPSILLQQNARGQLLRILYRLADMPLNNLEYWARQSPNIEAIRTADDQFLGHTFLLKGRVRQIDRVTLSEKEKITFGRNDVYRCHLVLNTKEGPLQSILYVWDVPSKLLHDPPIDAACGALATYLGASSTTDLDPPRFAATRLAWYPETVLGDLQMDAGLLETIKNSKPLRGEEHEAFYQMLAAVKRTVSGELVRRAYNQLVYEKSQLEEEKRDLTASKSPLNDAEKNRLALVETQLDYIRKNASSPFVPLVDKPNQFNGKLIMLRGTAYRIVKVRIPERKIRKRFGIDHYYQIDMRVNLEHKVKIKRTPNEGAPTDQAVDGKIVTQYPATFCALSLPPNMPVGDHLLEPIRVAGFYFKNWQYQTAVMRNDQAVERAAPMIIGRQPQWDVAEPSKLEQWAGVVIGVLFVVALLGIWGIVWWTGRGDAAFAEKIRPSAQHDERLALDGNLEYEEATQFDFEEETTEKPPSEPDHSA